LIFISVKNAIKLFESREIHTLWNDEEEEWYFSIIDVLSDSKILEYIGMI
jgi:general stress protein 26